MKIAFFTDNFCPELSGISDSIIATGTELARRGHQIKYFAPRYSKRGYQLAGATRQELDLGPNVKIHRMLSLPYKSPTLQGRAAIPNLLRGFFSKDKFDIIHSQSFFSSGVDALCLSKIKHTPLIGTNHTLIESFINYSPIHSQWVCNFIPRYVTWYYNQCNFVTAPSDSLLNDMKKKKLQISNRVVSNPIETSFFNPKSGKNILKKELGFSEFTILYVGRIAPEKNIDVLLEAFLSFIQDAPDAHLVIVGQGTARAALEKHVRASKMASRVKFLGPFLGVHKKKLYDVFHAADVFAIPSTSETQSMVTLQAMASSLPVVAARAGALPEVVTSERGLIFTPGNVEELRACLKRLYDQPSLREEFGHQGNLFARQFSPQEIADQWEKIYDSVIKQYYERKT